ncbi:tata box-binding protein associated factor RNA polymerase i subunit c [Anaeramoeba flamelloides]|uniref:Tata box-binding protein associated factor RNA polymerase i subunit c n=1 Tax=Anaeramoeba flamelloides TaxID=1746091 RepID=A0AAV7ZFQ7_9EUKA|nr:tata box-binding protein associated factor RNA polymerase i subunit c [Anaeramoeba flamelloides]
MWSEQLPWIFPPKYSHNFGTIGYALPPNWMLQRSNTRSNYGFSQESNLVQAYLCKDKSYKNPFNLTPRLKNQIATETSYVDRKLTDSYFPKSNLLKLSKESIPVSNKVKKKISDLLIVQLTDKILVIFVDGEFKNKLSFGILNLRPTKKQEQEKEKEKKKQKEKNNLIEMEIESESENENEKHQNLKIKKVLTIPLKQQIKKLHLNHLKGKSAIIAAQSDAFINFVEIDFNNDAINKKGTLNEKAIQKKNKNKNQKENENAYQNENENENENAPRISIIDIRNFSQKILDVSSSPYLVEFLILTEYDSLFHWRRLYNGEIILQEINCSLENFDQPLEIQKKMREMIEKKKLERMKEKKKIKILKIRIKKKQIIKRLDRKRKKKKQLKAINEEEENQEEVREMGMKGLKRKSSKGKSGALIHQNKNKFCLFGSHPRIVLIFSNQEIIKVDFRKHYIKKTLIMKQGANQKLLCVSKTNSRFQFALSTTSHIEIFDERYAHRPLLSIKHNSEHEPPKKLKFVKTRFQNKDFQLLITINSNHREVIGYLLDDQINANLSLFKKNENDPKINLYKHNKNNYNEDDDDDEEEGNSSDYDVDLGNKNKNIAKNLNHEDKIVRQPMCLIGIPFTIPIFNSVFSVPGQIRGREFTGFEIFPINKEKDNDVNENGNGNGNGNVDFESQDLDEKKYFLSLAQTKTGDIFLRKLSFGERTHILNSKPNFTEYKYLLKKRNFNKDVRDNTIWDISPFYSLIKNNKLLKKRYHLDKFAFQMSLNNNTNGKENDFGEDDGDDDDDDDDDDDEFNVSFNNVWTKFHKFSSVFKGCKKPYINVLHRYPQDLKKMPFLISKKEILTGLKLKQKDSAMTINSNPNLDPLSILNEYMKNPKIKNLKVGKPNIKNDKQSSSSKELVYKELIPKKIKRELDKGLKSENVDNYNNFENDETNFTNHFFEKLKNKWDLEKLEKLKILEEQKKLKELSQKKGKSVKQGKGRSIKQKKITRLKKKKTTKRRRRRKGF